jgi:hypothetical protein
MTKWLRGALVTLFLTSATLPAAMAAAQDAADEPLPPPPPEVQKLIDLAKEPDRLREALSDPAKIQQLMDSMESDVVRDFFRDPRRVQQLMREIDPLAVMQAMRAVDFTKVRQAALSRYKLRLKKQLEVSDEEWKALEPCIDKVILAQELARPPAGGGMRGGFGFGGGARLAPAVPAGGLPSEVQEAAAELRAALEDPDAQQIEVRRHVTAYQKARDKARQKLEAAQQELRDLLTLRQEAILVVAGLLN